jgi:2,3-bisphosphoglycerate-dependent phosphoglycerate mutase
LKLGTIDITQYNPKDPKYKDLKEDEYPRTENLLDTEERVLKYWHEIIVPSIKTGQRPIISAHGNTIRALVKYLDNIPDNGIVDINIPTGVPLVYELDDNLKPIRHYYLSMNGELPEGVIPENLPAK